MIYDAYLTVTNSEKRSVRPSNTWHKGPDLSEYGACDETTLLVKLITLELIYNALLVNELRLWLACRELMGNFATRKNWLDSSLELHAEIF